jgi:hypothetical protein
MSYPKRLGLNVKYPSMNVHTIGAQEELRRQMIEDEKVEFLINKTELNTVKTLFQLRNANYYKKSVRPIQLSDFETDVYPKERVFIAGKIFPFINIVFGPSKKTPSFQIIKPEYTELVQGASSIKHYDSKIHNSKYISINNNKISILLPKNYGDINFPQLMFDFLTNKSSVDKYIGGEFPDYETYCLALRNKAILLDDWKGQDGSWLTKDRDTNHSRWQKGFLYIIKNKIKGRLAPFSQIYDFYNSVDWLIRNTYKHEVKWCKGAKSLVKALGKSPLYLGGLEEGSNIIDNDVETILNELNLGICDFAVEKFHELIYGQYAKKPLKGDDAYNWDVAFIKHEQQVIAKPIYQKTSSDTIKKYQDMADKAIASSRMGFLSKGASVINDILPAFDDFTPPAKVTDDLFRTDLPLLMLYLDTHKISTQKVSPSLKNYLNFDGTVNETCKKIIEKYVIK